MKNLIFKKFLTDFSIFIVGLIVWTLQAVNYFDFVTQDGHGLKVYFLFTSLNFPKIVHRILPFIFFISLFWTIIKYENNNQLNIFWLNGVSKIKFTNITIIFSILIMIIQIFLGSIISPSSQFKARMLIKDSNVDFFTNLITKGKFINSVKGLTIFIEEKKQNEYLNIYIEDSSKGFNRIIYAKKGLLLSDEKKKIFLLRKGMVLDNNNNKINSFEFDQINFDLSNFGSNSITLPKIQEKKTIHLFKCIFDKQYSDLQNCEKSEILLETKQELLKRIFKPVYLILLGLLSCLLLNLSKFDSNYSLIKKLIFLIGILVLIISETSLRYSSISNLSLLIYIIIPLLIFLIFYFFTLYKNNYV
jgi:lipopolysaccharide export system permease protein